MVSDLRELPVTRAHPARRIRVHRGSESLILAPTLMSDAEEIAAAVDESRPALERFMPWAHHPGGTLFQLERLRTAEAEYFSGREFFMALFRERPNGPREFIAMAGLHPRVPLNPAGLEVGYWVRTRFAGRGYATFAVKCALVYAFDKLGADRVQVMCDEKNVASRRVIERCGFDLEGVMRNVTAAASPELTRAGFITSGNHPMFALVPRTFAALDWVEEIRTSMRYENLAGYELP